MATPVRRFGLPGTPGVSGAQAIDIARLQELARRADAEREKWSVVLQNPCDNLRLVYRAVIAVLKAKGALADKLGTARHYAAMPVETPKKEHDAVTEQLDCIRRALNIQRVFEEPGKAEAYYEAQEDAKLSGFRAPAAPPPEPEAPSSDDQKINMGLFAAVITALMAQFLGASFVISCASSAISYTATHIAGNWGVANE